MKSLTNQNLTIMAKVIFYSNSADCTLEMPNNLGGKTYTLFDSVSECVNYCREHGIEAEPVLEG